MKQKCPHCGYMFDPVDGKVPTHDFPKPTRLVCPGSGRPPVPISPHRHVEYMTQKEINRCTHREFAGLTTEGWYFWDETEAGAHGPFLDDSTANEKLVEYAKTI